MIFEDDIAYSVIPEIQKLTPDQMALRFREDLDLVNAIKLFDSIGDDFERFHQKAQETAIKKNLPSFLSSFMPKSAGTYIHNKLLDLGAVEIFHGTQNPINHYQMFYVESWLRTFLKGGAACHSHILPSPYNVDVLLRSGARKLWIHGRDPRQAALSSYWHQMGLGQGGGEIAKKRIEEQEATAAWAARIGLHPDTNDTFEGQIQFHFARAYSWARDWHHAQKLMPDIEFLFTTFEQFSSDRRLFAERVLNFYDYTPSKDPFGSDIGPNDRFRIGQSDEWRRTFSPALQEWCKDRIHPPLYAFFDWEI